MMPMNYLDFASDLPVNGRVIFSSAEESEEVMRQYGVDQQLRQTSKGSFQADCAMLRTEEAILSADRFAQACLAYYEPPAGTVSILLFRCVGGEFLVSGENVEKDNLVVVPHGYGTDLVFSNLAGSEAIAIPKTIYTELTEVLCPSREQPEGVQIAKGDPHLVNRIRNSLLRTMAGAESCDENIANLVASMVLAANSNPRAEPAEIFHLKQAKIDIAKQVQTFIDEYYWDKIRIEDLCRVTGREVRTLQRCFRQYFDFTISDYLKNVRLDAAHRALSAARPGEETVTSIAANSGFTHLGRFSVEYKKHFGESAFETLQNRKNSQSFLSRLI
jgi:AraC-like DNA-binding protein